MLESPLHGVDGFFREHTTLPAPGGYRTKAGIMTCFTYENTQFIFQ